MSVTDKKEKSGSYFYKLIRVGTGSDKVTTISLNPVLYASAVRLMQGSPREVGKFCRQVSQSFVKEEHGNRSGYVSSRLREKLDAIKKEQQSAKK